MTNRKRQTRSLEPKSASTDAPGSDWASRAATAVQRWSRHPILRTLQWALACFVIGGGGFLLVASADAQTPWFGTSAAERLGTAYMYDEEGSLLSETGTGGPNSSDSIQHIYLPTADGPMPVAVIINGAIYAVHSDQLNTPRKITNASGQTVWQWAYSAFGDDAPTTAANRFTGPHTVPKTGTTSVSPITYNIRYPGTYYDKESGLLENGYRSYAPSQGRYTQGDPIGLDGGWSRFNYVDGNPLGYVDPDGLAPKRPTDGLPPAIYSPTTGRPAGVSPVPGWRPAQIGGLGGSRAALLGRGTAIDPNCPPNGLTAKDGTPITGFTRHGIDRAIGDGGKRAGARPEAMLDALNNPTRIKDGFDAQGRPFRAFQGPDARVVVNPDTGKIISTNPSSRKGAN